MDYKRVVCQSRIFLLIIQVFKRKNIEELLGDKTSDEKIMGPTMRS